MVLLVCNFGRIQTHKCIDCDIGCTMRHRGSLSRNETPFLDTFVYFAHYEIAEINGPHHHLFCASLQPHFNEFRCLLWIQHCIWMRLFVPWRKHFITIHGTNFVVNASIFRWLNLFDRNLLNVLVIFRFSVLFAVQISLCKYWNNKGIKIHLTFAPK